MCPALCAFVDLGAHADAIDKGRTSLRAANIGLQPPLEVFDNATADGLEGRHAELEVSVAETFEVALADWGTRAAGGCGVDTELVMQLFDLGPADGFERRLAPATEAFEP